MTALNVWSIHLSYEFKLGKGAMGIGDEYGAVDSAPSRLTCALNGK